MVLEKPENGSLLDGFRGVDRKAEFFTNQPGQFTMATIRARLEGGTDPWADFAESRHGLGEAAKRLAKLSP